MFRYVSMIAAVVINSCAVPVSSYAASPHLMMDSAGRTLAPRQCSLLKRMAYPSYDGSRYYRYARHMIVPVYINKDMTLEMLHHYYRLPISTSSQEVVDNPNMYLLQCNTSGDHLP